MLLKLGVKGEQVKQVQQFLSITESGVFDVATENAVKNWQKANNLSADGKVGPKTWEAMGIASTDLREISESKESLIIDRSYLSIGQYHAGPTKKEWVFLHHTAGWNNPYATIKDWNNDTRGRIATEFVIGGLKITDNDPKYDGVVVQAFPDGGYAAHLGINSVMHNNSVGIEVCNFGGLGIDGNTWSKSKPDPSQTVTLAKPFRGYKSFQRYSDKQIQSLKELLLFIAERDNIDIRKGLPELIKQKGADAFDVYDVKMCEAQKGVWCHTNVRKASEKQDMFPQPELIDMLLSL